MLLLVGLGNPGPDYAGHRHNAGRMAVDAIVRRHGFGPGRSKFLGRLHEGRLAGEKVLALLPETYMNESGQSVAQALRFYKIPPEDLVVVHDEVDLAPAKLRVKHGGGAAGHNGLRSIDAHIGNAYRRVRIGIGHPGHKDLVRHYVLHDFSKAERAWLEPLLDAIAEAAPLLATGEDGLFMTRVAALVNPNPKNPPPAQADQSGGARDDGV